MKRADALIAAKVAGYHDDSSTFMRLLVEQRVNRQAMNTAWFAGQRSKVLRVPCDCHECKAKSAREATEDADASRAARDREEYARDTEAENRGRGP